MTRPHALVTGQLHEIQVKQDADMVTFTVDGKEHYRTQASLHGTITVYSGRTIAIQEIEIEGEPTDTKVEKASHKIYW